MNGKLNMRAIKVPFRFLWLALLTGCVTTVDRQLTPTSDVSRPEIVAIARQLSSVPNRQAGAGSGESMAPMYSENTLLIIDQSIAFESLEKDMIVAYRNKKGHRIVHRLALQKGDTWIAMGINNDYYDAEPVTRANLIGVVYGVLNSATATPPTSAPAR
jgi:hypothetical protein